MISRGHVYWVSFDGSVGAEIRKTRPAVVVSDDLYNIHMRTVTVAPLSSSVPARTFEVAVPAGILGDGRPCKVSAHQLRTVDKARLSKPLGKLPELLMRQVDASLREHLCL